MPLLLRVSVEKFLLRCHESSCNGSRLGWSSRLVCLAGIKLKPRILRDKTHFVDNHFPF